MKSEHQTRSFEVVLHEAIQFLSHLFAHVVGPVPDLAFPKHGRALEEKLAPCHLNTIWRCFISLKAAKRVEAAEADNLLGNSTVVLLLSEGDTEEGRKLPGNLERVRRHLFVPEKHHLSWPRRALIPVLKVVLPERAERRAALAEHGEGSVEADGGPCADHVLKVPPRDEGILGLPAEVHHPAAEGGDGGREQREGKVGRQQPRRRQRLQVVEVATTRGAEADEGHGHLWGGREQRVLLMVVVEAAAGAVEDGEGEGLEPVGSALGVRRQDDIVATGLEVVSHGHEFSYRV